MKKISKIFLGILCIFIYTNKVDAASLSVRTGSSTITKGNSAVITTTISASSPIVSIEGSLSCSGAGVSGGIDLRFDDSSNSVYTKTYTYTVKATTAGTINCTTSGVRLTEMASGSWVNLTNDYVKITVNNPPVIPPKVYSANNYLISLGVEGYELNQAFDKETLEYTVEVPNGTEKVVINAKTENSKASVKGSGEVQVNEGNNNIELVVTAENGNTRTYKLNIIVKELDPIDVEVDGNTYTVVRKSGEIERVNATYEETTVKINDQDVLAYHSKITGYTLVMLKDSNGVVNYYIYDNNKYSLYKEYTMGGITLYLTNKNYKDKNYKMTTFTYNDDEIKAYKLANNGIIKSTYAADESTKNFFLFYAINVETGKESLYQYDAVEGTVQRYNNDVEKVYQSKADNYKNYLYIAIGVIVITVIALLIALIIKLKNKNKNRRR